MRRDKNELGFALLFATTVSCIISPFHLRRCFSRCCHRAALLIAHRLNSERVFAVSDNNNGSSTRLVSTQLQHQPQPPRPARFLLPPSSLPSPSSLYICVQTGDHTSPALASSSSSASLPGSLSRLLLLSTPLIVSGSNHLDRRPNELLRCPTSLLASLR